MIDVTKENFKEFLTYYHGLHDAIFKNINFNILKDEVEIVLHIIWAGDTELDEDSKFKTVDSNIRLVFKGIRDINIKYIESVDYINEAYFKYINYQNEECICFAEDINKPYVYVVAKSFSYEEI